MSEVHLEIGLPRNRDYAGRMSVVVNGAEVGNYPVLGRGIHHRSVFERDSDTPTGEYRGTVEGPQLPQASYGPYGVIRLIAVGGDALIAVRDHGRGGLLIHSGDPNSVRARANPRVRLPASAEDLHTTHGCLRLSDAHLNELLEIIDGARLRDEVVGVSGPEISITVREIPLSR